MILVSFQMVTTIAAASTGPSLLQRQ